jgi:single-strand DNA-binding protein
MNTTRQSVEIAGILGTDPQITQSAGGRKIARSSLAAFKNMADQDGTGEKRKHWVKLIAWQGVADFMEKNLRKGIKVIVKGQMSSRSYEDHEGQTRFREELIVHAIFPIRARRNSAENNI